VTLVAGQTSGSPALADLDISVALAELNTGPMYFDRMSMRERTRTGASIAPELLKFDVLRCHGLPPPIWLGGRRGPAGPAARAIDGVLPRPSRLARRRRRWGTCADGSCRAWT
jgi:hypothetical protein